MKLLTSFLLTSALFAQGLPLNVGHGVYVTGGPAQFALQGLSTQ